MSTQDSGAHLVPPEWEPFAGRGTVEIHKSLCLGKLCKADDGTYTQVYCRVINRNGSGYEIKLAG